MLSEIGASWEGKKEKGGTVDLLYDLKKKRLYSYDSYDAIKRRMKQAALLPLLQPDRFAQLGIKPPSGLLLYGPSGNALLCAINWGYGDNFTFSFRLWEDGYGSSTRIRVDAKRHHYKRVCWDRL